MSDSLLLPKDAKHRQYRPSLGSEVSTIEQEARMVLPGIQALFGFQLVAVFSQGFKLSLSPSEQMVHLAALILSAISAMLVLAPAAYHRQANHQISRHFADLASTFLASAMYPLAIGTCLDIYLITQVIVHSYAVSGMIAGTLFSAYSWTWFIFPRMRAKKIKDLPVQPVTSSVN